MSQPRPTKSWILEQYSHRITFYAKMHSEMVIDEQYHRLDFASRVGGMPAGYEPKLPPTAFAAVQNLVDHVILGEAPEIEVEFPPGVHRLNTLEQTHMEKVRDFAAALWPTVNRHSTETPLRDFVTKAAAYGLGALCYPLAWDRWPTKPEKKSGEKPAEYRKRLREHDSKRMTSWIFDVRSVHPLNLYMDPTHDPPGDVIEVRPKALYQVKDAYGLPEVPEHPKRAGFGELVTEVEELIYVSPEWYAIYLNGRPLLTKEDHDADDDGVAPNPTGILWYKFAYGGFGTIDRYGFPQHRAVGILRRGRDTLDMGAEAINQVNALRGIAGFGSWLAIHKDGAEAANAELLLHPFKFGPGAIYPQGPDLSMQQAPRAEVPPVVFSSLDLLRNFEDMVFGAQVLRGVSDAGAAAARYRSQLAEARLMSQPLRQSCEQAVGGMETDMFSMVRDNPEELKEGLSVWGATKGKESYISLKPEEIPAGIVVRARFMPVTPEERAFKRQEGLTLFEKGAIGQTRFLTEYENVPDPLMALKEQTKDVIRKKMAEFAAEVAVKVAQKRLEAQHPDLFETPPAPGDDLVAPGAVEPNGAVPASLPEPGPGGYTQPGERATAPILASPQDMIRQAGGLRPRAPQVVGV